MAKKTLIGPIRRDTINDDRSKKFRDVIARRQNLTVILENVNDPHNVGAVIRSCDAIGISEVYIVYTENSYNFLSQKIGKNASSGARKWVEAHYFGDLMECLAAVRKKYTKIYGTHLSETSQSLFALDLKEPVALMFGNEQKGISDEALKELDGNFIIPQYGMVQSLNISVACAVSLFEASRQRKEVGLYDLPFDDNNVSHNAMYDAFIVKHFDYINKKED
jgi:tRNA (guanosine-2'-O-)-methyltransferase